jgi:hypothetical protein
VTTVVAACFAVVVLRHSGTVTESHTMIPGWPDGTCRARFGYVEMLYLTECGGLLLIVAG